MEMQDKQELIKLVAHALKNSGRTCDEDNWSEVMAIEAVNALKPYFDVAEINSVHLWGLLDVNAENIALKIRIRELEGDIQIYHLRLESKHTCITSEREIEIEKYVKKLEEENSETHARIWILQERLKEEINKNTTF